MGPTSWAAGAPQAPDLSSFSLHPLQFPLAQAERLPSSHSFSLSRVHPQLPPSSITLSQAGISFIHSAEYLAVHSLLTARPTTTCFGLVCSRQILRAYPVYHLSTLTSVRDVLLPALTCRFVHSSCHYVQRKIRLVFYALDEYPAVTPFLLSTKRITSLHHHKLYSSLFSCQADLSPANAVVLKTSIG